MTWDEFESSYRLLQEITTSGGATTHHALSSEGVVVMVHIVRAPDSTALLDRAETAAPQRVLERLEVDGASVLVTRFIMEFENLEVWVEAEEREGSGPTGEPGEARTATAPGLEASPEAGEPASDGPGEFTRMFRAQEGGSDPGGSDPDPSPEPTPSPPADEPGEFTRAFKAPAGPDDEPEPPPPPAPPSRPQPTRPAAEPPEPDYGSTAGTPDPDFGEASGPPEPSFEDPPAAPPSPPEREPPAEPSKPAPGEFTRLFRAPSPPSSSPPPAASGGSPPAGEFTARFRKPDPSAGGGQGWSLTGDAPERADELPDGYADRLRQSSRPSRPSQPPPPSNPPPSGPGSYTRVISARPQPSSTPSPEPATPTAEEPEAPAAKDAPPADEKKPSIVPFVVAIVLIVVTAVALVLGVALFA